MRLDQLRKLTDEQVEEKYDESTANTVVGLNFWRDELERRSREKLVASNQRLSRWSLGMSIVSGIASIAAVVLSIVTLTTSSS